MCTYSISQAKPRGGLCTMDKASRKESRFRSAALFHPDCLSEFEGRNHVMRLGGGYLVLLYGTQGFGW